MRMRVVQRLGDVTGNAHRLVDAELRLTVELPAQRLAVDERHHVIEETIRRA